jgi:hypothetical protein
VKELIGVGELDALGDAIVVAGRVVVTVAFAVWVAVAVEVAAEVAVVVGVAVEVLEAGGSNTRSRLTMRVAPPVTSKCHPSSHGGITPSQLPVVAKPAAVTGVAMLGSSPT